MPGTPGDSQEASSSDIKAMETISRNMLELAKCTAKRSAGDTSKVVVKGTIAEFDCHKGMLVTKAYITKMEDWLTINKDAATGTRAMELMADQIVTSCKSEQAVEFLVTSLPSMIKANPPSWKWFAKPWSAARATRSAWRTLPMTWRS